LGTQRGPDQIQQGHATGFDFDLQCLDVFTFAQQQPRRHAQQQQHWRCHTPQQLNPKKDVAVRHVGEHAFEIDQVLAQHGNGPTDFKNGDKDGWPEEKRKKEKKKEKMTTSKTSSRSDRTPTPTQTDHAMGNVTNNEINCIKLNPMDFAPSDSSKRPPSDNVI